MRVPVVKNCKQVVGCKWFAWLGWFNSVWLAIFWLAIFWLVFLAGYQRAIG
jgi:hypothetical protein